MFYQAVSHFKQINLYKFSKYSGYNFIELFSPIKRALALKISNKTELALSFYVSVNPIIVVYI